MDAKLKALKVVDLRDILARATVAAPAKANKHDLVAKIIASPAALAVYRSIHGGDGGGDDGGGRDDNRDDNRSDNRDDRGDDDLLAPPEDLDWNIDELAPDVPEPKPTEPAKVAKASEPVDEELEKRKARAARFGIPLVDRTTNKIPDDPSKLTVRAQRFNAGNKRPIQHDPIDPDEQERRKRRAERFGLPAA